MSAPTPLLTAKRAVSSACKKRPMPTCALSLACRRRLACNVPRQVGATYKGLWTKAKKNAEARRLGYTKRRFNGLDNAPHYVSPTLTYNLGRDYSLRAGQEVSLLTRAGRIHVPDLGWTRHVALLQAGSRLGGAKLWYDRSTQRFFLLVRWPSRRLIPPQPVSTRS